MKQLIVTADDYGMSPAVNRAIQEGIDHEIITSTNVMMNMPFCDDTERIRGKNVSIGIHWNLTCGRPVLPSDQIPSITNKDGSFYSLSEFRYLYKSGKISNDEIVKELTAQYNKYRRIWGEPEYWNSHEHIHLGIKVFQVFLKTAVDLDIRKMRSNNRIYVPAKSGRNTSSFIWKILEPAKRIVFSSMRREATGKGILSPDGRICCLDKADIHDFEYILSNIQWKKCTTAEFTIHPAAECDSPFFGNMVDSRLEEYRMVTNSSVLSMIENSDTKLISFDEIR